MEGQRRDSARALPACAGRGHRRFRGRGGRGALGQTVVTLTPASVRAARMRGLADWSVISSLTVLISQIWAKATRPILELSATTTTERERSIRARLVWASTS